MGKKKAKVLVVDDDPDLVEAAKNVLQTRYTVATACNGEEGLKMIVEERPDLVILDVVMPVKDGFEVCRELKENPYYHFFSKTPVLLLTVFPHGIEKTNIPLSAARELEAEDYIQKPVSPEELLRRVSALLK